MGAKSNASDSLGASVDLLGIACSLLPEEGKERRGWPVFVYIAASTRLLLFDIDSPRRCERY
jgi:hypothetical protein